MACSFLLQDLGSLGAYFGHCCSWSLLHALAEAAHEGHGFMQVMLERVESFHAEDNPFEAENGSGQWQLQSNWSVHAIPNREMTVNAGLQNDAQQQGGYQSCFTSLQSGPLGKSSKPDAPYRRPTVSILSTHLMLTGCPQAQGFHSWPWVRAL